MDYTLSNAYRVHGSTGQRMHSESQALPTAVSEQDLNALIWSLMEVIKAAGLAGVQFDADMPASYQVLLQAVQKLIHGGVAPVSEEQLVLGQTLETLGQRLDSLARNVSDLADSLSAYVPHGDFIGGNQALAASGWQRLPGGLILQWGGSPSMAWDTNVTLNFPLAFPTACLRAYGSIRIENEGDDDTLARVIWTSTTQIMMRCDRIADLSVGDVGRHVDYLAIGY
ncbi:MAG: hypothetical protein QM617_09205 [Comamonas sp.]